MYLKNNNTKDKSRKGKLFIAIKIKTENIKTKQQFCFKITYKSTKTEVA